MHLSAAAQARLHLEHVRAALPTTWRDFPITSHAPAPPLAYRTRTRVHVRCDRGRVDVGMHEARTNAPVVVERCAVLDPAVETARAGLASLLEGSRGAGDVQIALGTRRLPVLEVRWDGELARECFGRLERAVVAGQVAGARVTAGETSRPAVIGDPTPWIRGGDGEPLRLAPGGFAQASEAANSALVQYVGDRVASAPPDKAVELYAGAGNVSVMLARHTSDLATVEASRESCDAARANLAARSLVARVIEGDVETYAIRPSTRLVVLDPPRTGARAVAEQLAGSRIPRIIYISCDPQTLGRDLGILSTAYAPRSIAAFEMFPQTSHVETVVELARLRGRRGEVS
jgi:23S rRNA (uracil1939-C5)-methyltransferase